MLFLGSGDENSKRRFLLFLKITTSRILCLILWQLGLYNKEHLSKVSRYLK